MHIPKLGSQLLDFWQYMVALYWLF